MSWTGKRGWFALGIGVPLLVALAGAIAVAAGFSPRENVWSIAIYEGISPFELAPIEPENRPVLSAEDVSDVPALFVADPFMVEEGKRWFMFFEVLNKTTGHGDIGLATSEDAGIHWSYQQIVLDEPFHLSYPAVFRWNGNWFMVPVSQAAGEVRIYQASEFPVAWEHVETLLEGERLADPTLFQRGDLWWMFVGRSHTHDRLRLFFSKGLLGTWQEHPASPVVDGNADIARPGGPVGEVDGELYRMGQDCNPKYGNQLRAFRITRLTPSEYGEEPVWGAPLLRAGESGWNANGMHHSDLHRMPDGSWRAAVDGHRKTWFATAR